MPVRPLVRPLIRPLARPSGGFGPVLGGGGSGGPYVYVIEATNLFARFTTPPTESRKLLINTLITSLMSAGVWSVLDAFYGIAGADEQAGQRNWIQDAYNLSPTNSPAFTADRGYAGNGTTSYVSTTFNPTTAVAPNYVLNSASWGLFSRTSTDSGEIDGSTNAFLSLRSSNIVTWRTNTNTSDTAASTDGSGHFVASRVGALAADSSVYRNGAALTPTSQTAASVAIDNLALFIGARNVAGSPASLGTRQFAAASIGGGLTAQQVASLYSATLAYLQGVGAA